jgi:histone H3/H4
MIELSKAPVDESCRTAARPERRSRRATGSAYACACACVENIASLRRVRLATRYPDHEDR